MLLVTGATGHVGTHVVRELAGRGERVRALVRDPARAGVLPDGVEPATGDLGAPATLKAAMGGVDGLFLLTPGIDTALARHAVDAARAAGVRRVVLLSSTNVLGDPMPAMGSWHHEKEVLVRESGIPFTILRPNGFMTNTLEWLRNLRRDGYLLDATGPGRQAFIAPADIGATAAAVLTGDGHDGKAYTLTGPEPLTAADQAATLSEVLGFPLPVRTVSAPDEVVAARFPNGAPPALAAAVVELASLMRADTVGAPTGTVERLTGRRPRTYREWCVGEREMLASLSGRA